MWSLKIVKLKILLIIIPLMAKKLSRFQLKQQKLSYWDQGPIVSVRVLSFIIVVFMPPGQSEKLVMNH